MPRRIKVLISVLAAVVLLTAGKCSSDMPMHGAPLLNMG